MVLKHFQCCPKLCLWMDSSPPVQSSSTHSSQAIDTIFQTKVMLEHSLSFSSQIVFILFSFQIFRHERWRFLYFFAWSLSPSCLLLCMRCRRRHRGSSSKCGLDYWKGGQNILKLSDVVPFWLLLFSYVGLARLADW